MAESRATDVITALIVDDEQLARDELGYLLSEHPEIEVVGQAANGPEALRMIEDLQPDVVFLDVQMPGLDGLSVARRVIERGGPLPHFIFATAFDQYAVEAFEVDAADYLLKPVEKQRLAKSIERARKLSDAPDARASRVERLLQQFQSANRPPARVLVRSNQRMLLVDAADIIYAAIADGQITIVATGVEGLSNYRTIEELQSRLDPNVFWRPHRS